VEVATISLTRGQINAVRAALKAGIKPALIARQFGISQSDVRKVLASDANRGNPQGFLGSCDGEVVELGRTPGRTL
jgi:hypothetical protein